MSYVLGIDVGGTKVLAGVIDMETGMVIATEKKRTRAEHNQGDILDRIVEAAETAIEKTGLDRHQISRAGMGVAGQLNRKRGLIVNAPNLANMSNVPISEIVGGKLNLKVSLANDVEAAAAGEATFGSGKGHSDFVVIFVGTGIGGMVYREGKPYPGASQTAGEIGHIVIDHGGRLCACGGVGHLEAYASRTAIVRYMLAGMHLGRQSCLSTVVTEINPNDPGGSGLRSGVIADALERKDPLVQEALYMGAEHLASGLCTIINFYNPPLIILGGGLVEAVDPFYQQAARRAREMALRLPAGVVEVKKAGLGDFSGIVGAAVIASRAA